MKYATAINTRAGNIIILAPAAGNDLLAVFVFVFVFVVFVLFVLVLLFLFVLLLVFVLVFLFVLLFVFVFLFVLLFVFLSVLLFVFLSVFVFVSELSLLSLFTAFTVKLTLLVISSVWPDSVVKINCEYWIAFLISPVVASDFTLNFIFSKSVADVTALLKSITIFASFSVTGLPLNAT